MNGRFSSWIKLEKEICSCGLKVYNKIEFIDFKRQSDVYFDTICTIDLFRLALCWFKFEWRMYSLWKLHFWLITWGEIGKNEMTLFCLFAAKQYQEISHKMNKLTKRAESSFHTSMQIMVKKLSKFPNEKKVKTEQQIVASTYCARIQQIVRIGGILKAIHSAIAFLKLSHGKQNKGRKKTSKTKEINKQMSSYDAMHCYLILSGWLNEDSTKPNQIQSTWMRERDCFKCMYIVV